ncbi:MAG TPA: ABC transporter ATP-binding protein [Candidatus Baltobacteraceae bacterium]|nr:ABC transporter ATP-binding protein [Candidatus Baltobacteraceae bacterium]
MLSVRNLTKRYDNQLAVADLTFELAPGEIISVLGPNGAGKTTTFLMLCGLVRPTAGTILWNGSAIGAQRGRTIALIPETPEVYGALTVWEHVVFVARSCNVPGGWETRAEELLERFHLSDQRDTVGARLSKGMQQKTLIVATLIADPPVLLFDEPMIGLDPAGQRELREVIADLARGGKTVAVSTHMLDAARAMSERTLILKAGSKIFDGSLAGLAGEGEDLESAFLRITA